jgi:hypothetical protein
MQELEVKKLEAEIVKLVRESDKLLVETRWYPIVIAGSLIGAVIAFTKLLLS